MLDQIAAVKAKRETLRVLRSQLDDLEAERRALRTRANIGLVHEEAKARMAVLAAEIRDRTARVRALEGEIRRAEATLINTAALIRLIAGDQLPRDRV